LVLEHFLGVSRGGVLKGGEMARDAGVSLKVRGTSQKALAGGVFFQLFYI